MEGSNQKPHWRFIGQPSWPSAEGDLAQRLGRKQRALLAYLIVNDRPSSRDELSELFWPDSEASRGRHSLRQTLVSIRKALGDSMADCLVADGDDVGFDTSGIVTDLDAFATYEAGVPDNPEVLLSILNGPLLEGVSVRSPQFENRMTELRAAFASRAARVLEMTLDRVGGDISEKELAELRQRRDFYLGFVSDILEKTLVSSARTAHGARQARRTGWKLGMAGMLGLAIGVLLIVSGLVLSQDFRSAMRDIVDLRRGDVPRIAVRPFESRGGLDAERSLAGGVTIGVTYALYAITERELFVVTVPATSAADVASDEAEYADRLGVRYLISGTLETDQGRVRVFVRLYDADLGADIWQDRFDSALTEAFSLQDEITLRMLQGLKIDLSSAERNRLQYLDDTENLNAWLYAANGVRNLIKLDPKNLDEALDSYRAALEIDPDYTSARRGLAWHALLDVRFGTAADPERSILEARQHLDVILRRRPNDGMSKALEGLMLILENDWDAAIASGREAARLLPGSADVWAVLAHNYTFAGKPELARDAIDRAMQLSPGHPDFYKWIKGRAYRLEGEHELAIALLEPEPGGPDPTLVQLVELAAAYVGANRMTDAVETARKIRNVAPEFRASEWVLHPAMQDPNAQSIEFELLSKAGL
jgi:TolB-like protein